MMTMKRATACLAALAALSLVVGCAPAMTDEPAAAAGPASAALPDVTATYACEPAMSLTVTYNNTDQTKPAAVVTLDGKAYAMEAVMSGSGAKFRTAAGRSAGKSLVWWNKGDDGTLFEGSSADANVDEAVLAECTGATG
jgi:membrane-bound inhibitor of C-type lysozyme